MSTLDKIQLLYAIDHLLQVWEDCDYTFDDQGEKVCIPNELVDALNNLKDKWCDS